jgi:hypothetical protein
MADDTSVGSRLLIPRQKYTAKAANLGPGEVEYDGITYKIYRHHLIYRSMVHLLIMVLTVALLVPTTTSLRQHTKRNVMSTLRVLVTTSSLKDALSQQEPSHSQSNDPYPSHINCPLSHVNFLMEILNMESFNFVVHVTNTVTIFVIPHFGTKNSSLELMSISMKKYIMMVVCLQ